MLDKYHVEPQQIGARKVLAESFDAPTERMLDITPLLYQSGYVTIKGYSPLTNLYTLDIPNKEVRMGLLKSLLPGFLHQYTADGLTTVALLFEAIAGERMDDALRLLQTFLSTILNVTIRITRVITSRCFIRSSACLECMWTWKSVPPKAVWTW